MFTTLVAAVALAGYDPAPGVPVHKAPGPAFSIPCRVDGAKDIERVQLYVSNSRGETWSLYEEITPDKGAFTFLARKPGEYWFTARIKKKDGTFDPADPTKFVVMQRVAVETGAGYEPPAPPLPPPSATAIVEQLEAELNQVELDLIRKEIKRLSELKEFSREAEARIDRLRYRLQEVSTRLRGENTPRAIDTTIPPVSGIPPSAIPSVQPESRPVAPMPRIRGTRY